jgi:aminopeptidase YwaD
MAHFYDEIQVDFFEFPDWVCKEHRLRITSPFSAEIKSLPLANSAQVSGDSGHLQLVDMRDRPLSLMKRNRIAGKAVLVSVGGSHRIEKYAKAEAEGASAFILTHDTPRDLIEAGAVKMGSIGKIPAFSISYQDGRWLGGMARTYETWIELLLEYTSPTARSANICVTTNELSGQGIICIGAHYDSWDISPGASDNASGVAVLLELARMFHESQDSGLLLVAFGAEELGLFGSEHFIEHAVGLPIQLFINLDNLGSAGGHLQIRATNEEWLEALINQTMEECCIDCEMLPLHPYGDHQNFASKSIPSIHLSHMPNVFYHTYQDIVKNLDLRKLLEASRVAFGIVRHFKRAFRVGF